MNKYERYAVIRKQMKELKKEADELEMELLEEVKHLSAPMKTAAGIFTTVTRTSWKYTEAVDYARERAQVAVDAAYEGVKALMKEEEKNGLAEKEEKVGLRFTEAKQS